MEQYNLLGPRGENPVDDPPKLRAWEQETSVTVSTPFVAGIVFATKVMDALNSRRSLDWTVSSRPRQQIPADCFPEAMVGVETVVGMGAVFRGTLWG